jgi:ATP-dependent protease HslVU (ClpYQ) peptidase subunit
VTCVVGIRGKGGVLLAGDSQWSTPWTKRERVNAKTFQLHPTVAVAFCGSARLGQILTYHLDSLEPPPLGMDEHYWAVKIFIPHLREVTEAHGHLHVHHNVEHIGESGFLLAVRGRLFAVEGDLQVGEGRLCYETLGTGEETAIGALRAALGEEATEPRPDDELEKLAEDAIVASAEFTNFVGGDITMARTVCWTSRERALARQILA